MAIKRIIGLIKEIIVSDRYGKIDHMKLLFTIWLSIILLLLSPNILIAGQQPQEYHPHQDAYDWINSRGDQNNLVKDIGNYIPLRKFKPLPGKVIGVILKNDQPFMPMESRSMTDVAFSSSESSYFWINPRAKQPVEGGYQFVIDDKGTEKLIPNLNHQDFSYFAEWGIKDPYTLVEIEVNEGYGHHTNECGIAATNIKVLSGTKDYPLNINLVVEQAKQRYQQFLKQQQTNIALDFNKAEQEALGLRTANGIKETQTLFYITWLPESEKLMLRFFTQVTDSFIKQEDSGHRKYGISYGVDFGMQYLVSKQGRIVSSQPRPINYFSHTIGTPEEIETAKENFNPQLFSFSADGKYGAAASLNALDINVHLFDINSREEVRKFVGHGDFIDAVLISPDSNYIVSASRDLTVIIWDLHTGKELYKLTGYKKRVTSLAFSPDSRLVLTSSRDDTNNTQNFRLWDLHTGKEIKSLNYNLYIAPFTSIALSQTGLAIVGNLVFDLNKEGPPVKLSDQVIFVREVIYFSDKQSFAISTQNGLIRIYRIDSAANGITATLINSIKSDGNYTCFAISSDGTKLLAGGGSITSDNIGVLVHHVHEKIERIRLWDINNPSEIDIYYGNYGLAKKLFIAPDGQRAFSFDGAKIYVCDLNSGILLFQIDTEN